MEFQNRPATVITASLVIVIAFALIWHRFETPPLVYDLTEANSITSACGETLAAETVQAIHDQGRIVVVSVVDFERARNQAWVAFSKILKNHHSITVDRTIVIPLDPHEPAACEPAALQKVLEQSSRADAIVIFCGLPKWSQVEAFVKPANAKILVLDMNGVFAMKTRYSGYFEQGILAALISLRGADSGVAPVGKPRIPREWFDRSYKVFTPDNYDSLPNETLRGMKSRPQSR